MTKKDSALFRAFGTIEIVVGFAVMVLALVFDDGLNANFRLTVIVASFMLFFFNVFLVASQIYEGEEKETVLFRFDEDAKILDYLKFSEQRKENEKKTEIKGEAIAVLATLLVLTVACFVGLAIERSDYDFWFAQLLLYRVATEVVLATYLYMAHFYQDKDFKVLGTENT